MTAHSAGQFLHGSQVNSGRKNEQVLSHSNGRNERKGVAALNRRRYRGTLCNPGNYPDDIPQILRWVRLAQEIN
jgi:hypothetical protein